MLGSRHMGASLALNQVCNSCIFSILFLSLPLCETGVMMSCLGETLGVSCWGSASISRRLGSRFPASQVKSLKVSPLCPPPVEFFPEPPGSLSLPWASWVFPLGKHIKGGAGCLQADELPTSAWPHQQSSRPRAGGGCRLSNTTLSAHIFGRKLFLSFLKRGHTHTYTHRERSNQINTPNHIHSVNERGLVSWSCPLPVGILA